MKPCITTSYGWIEQKNSNVLVSTENDTGIYVSFNLIGIAILVMSGFSFVTLAFKKTSEFEIVRDAIVETLLTAPTKTYYWAIALFSFLLLGFALHFLIKGRMDYYLKYLSGFLFFVSAFLLASLTNIERFSQQLSLVVSNVPAELLYGGSILVVLFLMYVGIGFWKSPFPYYRQRIIIFDKKSGHLIQKILRNPIPLLVYRNGGIGFNSSWIDEKYEYPLSDVVSVHQYTSENSDEFTFFAMLRFTKTGTYFPTVESRAIEEHNQVINILCQFLSLPRGEDLNNKRIGVSNPLLKVSIDHILCPNQQINAESNLILRTHNQKIAVSAVMMLEENQRRLAHNDDNPEANLMLGLAFMGMNLLDAASEKLQKAKALYEQFGQKREAVKVKYYLDKLHLYLIAKSRLT